MTDKLPETNSPAFVPEGEEEEDAVADSGNGSPVDVHQDLSQTYSGAPKDNFEGEPTTREGMRLLNEKYRALKELIPSCSETNREPEKVLDDAVEYLKFLQHQVAGLHQMSGLGPFSAPHAAAGLHPMSGLGPFPPPPHVQRSNQENSSQTNQEAINASPVCIIGEVSGGNLSFLLNLCTQVTRAEVLWRRKQSSQHLTCLALRESK